MPTLVEIRILPPIAIARMGDANEPMANYDFTQTLSNRGIRELAYKDSLEIKDGKTVRLERNEPMAERVKPSDFTQLHNGRKSIKPVAPFIELWGIFSDDKSKLVRLTPNNLINAGINLADLEWQVEAANRKMYRRTNDKRDIIEPKKSTDSIGYNPAQTIRVNASDPLKQVINARADTFKNKDKTIFLGQIQAFPAEQNEAIRLRFTPSKGKLYHGTEFDSAQSDHCEEIELISTWNDLDYDKEPYKPHQPHPSDTMSNGKFDDACDCLITIKLNNGLTAKSRIFSAPPDFSPDTEFYRTAYDEFEQYLLGNEVNDVDYPNTAEGNQQLLADLLNIIQRATDTVSMIDPYTNARRWYSKSSLDEKKQTSGDHYFTNKYALDKHLNLFKSIESFLDKKQNQENKAQLSALIARFYARFRITTQSPENRGNSHFDEETYLMPMFMRGSDAQFLVLTDRQRDKFRFAIEHFFDNPSNTFSDNSFRQKADKNGEDVTEINASNIMQLLDYRPFGNPPSTSIKSTVANCYPGLEFDLRGIWQHLLSADITTLDRTKSKWEDDWIIHETKNQLLFTQDGKQSSKKIKLVESDGHTQVELDYNEYLDATSTDRFNRLTRLINNRNDENPLYLDVETEPTVQVQLNEIIDKKTGHILRGDAGELTHGLCSPWQMDFNDCGCAYWSASRPDFVNVDQNTSNGEQNSSEKGQHWMNDSNDIKYVKDALYTDWRNLLLFVIQGKTND